MECWDTHVGKHPWNIGMPEVPGTGESAGQVPKFGCHPPNPRCFWSSAPSWGALNDCKSAKVTPAGLLPALGDATSALLELDQEQLFPPRALESQPRREKLLGWDGVSGTDVALLGSGCSKRWILDACPKIPSVSRTVGIILKDFSSLLPSQFAAVGPSKERGKSGKSQTPSMVAWMNHKMLQSLLLYMQGSLKE